MDDNTTKMDVLAKAAEAVETKNSMGDDSDHDQRNTIYGYALDLISLVCNNSYIGMIVDNPPHRILDTPQFGYTVETEPEKERLMRLQVNVTVLLPNVY